MYAVSIQNLLKQPAGVYSSLSPLEREPKGAYRARDRQDKIPSKVTIQLTGTEKELWTAGDRSLLQGRMHQKLQHRHFGFVL